MDCTPDNLNPARSRTSAALALAAILLGCLLLCPPSTRAAAPTQPAPSASASAAGTPADHSHATPATETIGARPTGTTIPAGAPTTPLTTNLPSLGRAPTPLPDATFSLVRVFGALTLVLGLFLGGVWAVKNWHRFAAQRGQAQQLQILETRSLGGRHALYVVGYQGQRLLLAGSPTGVTLVSHLPSADAPAAEGAETTEATTATAATPARAFPAPTQFPGARTPLPPGDDGRHFVQVLQQALQQKP